ncbi:hypothetical protein [Bauldia sp.]|uniref:hypothetical protein n=1 Tax=Bauldia sp. TaxID=2575872 RepID=UPI003BAB697C
MRTTLTAIALTLAPGLAFAHTAIVDHAHPHDAAHPYLGLETLLLVATATAVAGVAGYALRARRERNK